MTQRQMPEGVVGCLKMMAVLMAQMRFRKWVAWDGANRTVAVFDFYNEKIIISGGAVHCEWHYLRAGKFARGTKPGRTYAWLSMAIAFRRHVVSVSAGTWGKPYAASCRAAQATRR